MKTVNHCGICLSQNLEEVWNLPALPLTEQFGPYAPSNCPPIDQKLLLCSSCGHIQLGYQIDPDILYGSKYSFRTSASHSAKSGTELFLNFLTKHTADRRFQSLVDIGGNDLYLAKKMVEQANYRAVIDPVCQAQHGQDVEGIKIFGCLVEKVNLSQDLKKPDLVVSRHTLEHIANPLEFFQQLFSQCDEDCLYFFEIPCMERLSESLRFDAIFHQHYHYYDIHSFLNLLQKVGGEYLDHSYNYQGSCGGALLVAFRKAKKSSSILHPEVKNRKQILEKKIRMFTNQMDILSDQLSSLPGPIYGYGASLMLATLSYHLKNDFSCLESILDDDPTKNGMTYQNIPVTIRHTGLVKPDENSCYLITSLENCRSIYKRLLDLKPRHILMPLAS